MRKITLKKHRLSVRTFRRVGVVAIVFVYACVSILHMSTATAISSDLYETLKSGVYYADPDADCSTFGTDVGNTAVGNHGAATWNSTVQPPYYLEEFVINVLQDIAQVANVPTSDTVTQEHVTAMVAWAWEEGGNIANTDIFNPWNTGLNDPSLLAGANASNGVQSFKSFNAGVTAATITITGTNQNRIEKDLIDPNSTAEQFMQALTYYQRYPGNQAWAGADVTDQQAYLNGLMQILSQTRQSYDQYASVIIGPGEEDSHHVPTSQLKYHSGSGSNPTAGSGGLAGSACTASMVSVNCPGSSGQANSSNAAIACQAQKYDELSYSQGWHSSGSMFHQNCDSAYQGSSPPEQVSGHAVGPRCATDCSGLVNIVLYDLFQNDMNETTFTEVTDTANFKKIPFSQVEPGDLIQPNPDHVEIVEQVHGTTLNTFAAHTSGVPQPDQTGPAVYPNANNPSYVYLRYIGRGSTS